MSLCVALLAALACDPDPDPDPDPTVGTPADGRSERGLIEALAVTDGAVAEVASADDASAPSASEVGPERGDAGSEQGVGRSERSEPRSERSDRSGRSDRPPADPEAIGPWLLAGGYLGWEPRSAVHRTDEHGGARVLFNPLLAASFAAEAEQHPLGAAAVRELYEADLVTPKGLALMVKVGERGESAREARTGAEAAADERGWFWYEVFSVDDDAAPTVAQVDAPGCLGCHSAGVDLVMPPESEGRAAKVARAGAGARLSGFRGGGRVDRSPPS